MVIIWVIMCEINHVKCSVPFVGDRTVKISKSWI